MTASTKPKTPSMVLPVRPGISRVDVDLFCKRAGRLTLSQLVDTVIVKERLIVQGQSRSKEYTIEITFFPPDEYRKEYDITSTEILAAFSQVFPLMLKKEITTELKKLDASLKGQMADVGKGRSERNDAAAAEDGDEDEEGEAPSRRREEELSEIGDGDAEDEKRARQSKQQSSYESDNGGEDDEDLDQDAAIEAAFADVAADDEDAMSVDDSPESKKSKKKALKAQVEDVEITFRDIFNPTKSFAFTEEGVTIELEVRISHINLFWAETNLVIVVFRRYTKTATRGHR
jgi:hypothetical protein